MVVYVPTMYIMLALGHRAGDLSLSYLNLQQVIATDALVVHLIVCIVSISAVLVLDESKTIECQHCNIVCDAGIVLQSAGSGSWCRNVAANKSTVSSSLSALHSSCVDRAQCVSSSGAESSKGATGRDIDNSSMRAMDWICCSSARFGSGGRTVRIRRRDRARECHGQSH